VTRLRSAICSHPSRMWITVARGESCIKVKKSLAPVTGRPCSQVTSCMLSRRPSPRIASVSAARSPSSVVVSGIFGGRGALSAFGRVHSGVSRLLA